MVALDTIIVVTQFYQRILFIQSGTLFADMYHTNGLLAFQKNILSLGVYLISLLCSDWLKKSEHLPEFFLLMCSSLLGMFLLISSGNLLMFYLSLELASIPVAAMANFDLHKKSASEGAMKLIFISAFASAVLLFGISLIYGATGTISFDSLAQVVTDNPLQILAFVFSLQHLRLNFLLFLFIYGLPMYMKGHPLPPHHIFQSFQKGQSHLFSLLFCTKYLLHWKMSGTGCW
jgi:NADH-quinone oxidoreductase subunit N